MNEFLSNLNLSKDEKIFSSHIEDCIKISNRKNIPKFSGFLDLRQQKIAQATAESLNHCRFTFFGGVDSAERKMFGVFPEYVDDFNSEFPICIICAEHKRELSHKDFLGSLMSLGIKREVIGDIFVGKNKSYIAVQKNIVNHILNNISKIGNVGVKLLVSDFNEIPLIENNFIEDKIIVSSMRIDCVISALCNKSRSGAAKFISSEKVSINHEIILSPSKNVNEGDTITVRSFGKFCIEKCISKTKKERLVLSYKKYI